MIKKALVGGERVSEAKVGRPSTTPTEERVKSCFSKKGSRGQEPYGRGQGSVEQTSDVNRKTKLSGRGGSASRNRKSDNKEGDRVGSSDERSEGRQTTSPENDDCVKYIAQLVIGDLELQPRPSTLYYQLTKASPFVYEYLVSKCSVYELKNLHCYKLNDCDFFDPDENSQGKGRLLMLQYQYKYLYINESKQRRSPGKGKIPDYIMTAWRDSRRSATLEKGFFAINKKIVRPQTVMAVGRRDNDFRTEETYDTSNPSTYQQNFTPEGLTPRSNLSLLHYGNSSSRKHQYQSPPMPTIMSMEEPLNQTTTEMSQDSMMMQMVPAMVVPYYQQYQYYEEKKEPEIVPPHHHHSHNANRRRRAISFEESKAYVIDLDRIEYDGRTTIMIRNIPNKYTYEMLLYLIQETHSKKYDFFYLPIDYTNRCNMGYAFINFLHTKFIPDFFRRFNDKKWELFNSEKICSLAYARIQGTVSLMNHFENSNVMNRGHRRMRPILDVSQTLLMSDLSVIIERQRQEQEH